MTKEKVIEFWPRKIAKEEKEREKQRDAVLEMVRRKQESDAAFIRRVFFENDDGENI